MYISDAIAYAKRLVPSEYTSDEYLRWCDELSADIRRNYDIQYGKFTDRGNLILLPEGVTENDIAKIVMDGKELKKTNLLDFGIRYEYTNAGRFLKKTDSSVSDFEIIYKIPYSAIRYVNEDCEASFTDGRFSAPVHILPGDNLQITAGENKYMIIVTDMDNEGYTYIGEAVPTGTYNVNILRQVTEETLLPPPYDSAYIDFLNAKVCLYQGDTNGYRTHAEQYNTKLRDYRTYLSRNMPRNVIKFTNWI